MDVEPNDQPYDSIADGQLPKFVCVVPPKSLKLLGKIIQCLDRVGEELFWDAQPDRVRISHNSCLAVACAKFSWNSVSFSLS